MKTFVLTTLIVFISVVSYGQDKQSNKLVEEALNLKLTPPNTPLSIIKKDQALSKKEARVNVYVEQLKPVFEAKNLASQLLKEPHKSNMPCYVPPANDLMPVMKPDSTVQYSLLIQDLNQH
ncbi:MAG: hypothetical protein N4A71_01665 [Carboxylicivirga sp.]|nr:hypothetical protein [Carboxylicivirga sp.]